MKKLIGILSISLLFMFGIHELIFIPFIFLDITTFTILPILKYGIYLLLFLIGLFLYIKGILKVNLKNFLINLFIIIFSTTILFILSIIEYIKISKKLYIEEVENITNNFFDINYFDFINIFIRTTEININNINFRLLLGIIFFVILNLSLIYFIRKEIKKEKGLKIN